MIPCPCRAVRSRSSRDVALDHVGDGGLEEHLDGLGVAGEQLLELRPIGGVADPHVAVAGPQGPADAVEQGAVGPVAVDVGRRQLGDGGRAAIGVLPQGDGACHR